MTHFIRLFSFSLILLLFIYLTYRALSEIFNIKEDLHKKILNKKVGKILLVSFMWRMAVQLISYMASYINSNSGEEGYVLLKFFDISRIWPLDLIGGSGTANTWYVGGISDNTDGLFLFNWLVKLFGDIIDDYSGAAFIITIVSFMLASVILYYIVKERYGEDVAGTVLFIMNAFPLSIVFNMPVSEGVFFLLIIMSFYFMGKKHFILSAVIGCISVLIDLRGVALLPALIYELVQYSGFEKSDKIRRISASCILYIMPFISIGFYDHAKYGQALYFLRGIDDSKYKLTLNNGNLNTALVINLLVLILLAFVLILFNNRIKLSYMIFSFAALLIPFISGAVMLRLRNLVVIFPIYIAAALAAKKGIRRDLAYFTSVTLLGFVITFYFGRALII